MALHREVVRDVHRDGEAPTRQLAGGGDETQQRPPCIYIYIYMYRERERDRDIDVYIYIYIYIYVHVTVY